MPNCHGAANLCQCRIYEDTREFCSQSSRSLLTNSLCCMTSDYDRTPFYETGRKLPSFGERTEAAKKHLAVDLEQPNHSALGTRETSLPRPILGSLPTCTHSNGSDVWSGAASSCSSMDAAGSVGGSPPKSETSERSSRGGIRYCGFCRKNGEQPATYLSHTLHSISNDGQRIVQCPVLRSVRCGFCGATGDLAHTQSHCPQSKERVPVALLLKNTPRQCDGSLRRRRVVNFF